MAKSAKPTSTPAPPGEPREGVVASVERRQTKAGNPMLVLAIGEERISFFEAEDVTQDAKIGDAVTFALTRKGTYLNGKGLAVLPKSAQQPAPAPTPQPQPQPPAPAPKQPKPVYARSPVGGRPALHELDETQLLDLYAEESQAAKIEPARLGQISNQVRYARIENELRETEKLLREILALMQKSYLGTS